MLRLTATACLLSATPLGFIRAQSPSAELPPAAYSVGVTYDASRSRVVTFGGFMRGQYVGDTWEHDGTQWQKSAGPGPFARNGPELAYDSERKQLVLFGGDTRSTGPLGETWLREGSVWREVKGAGPPPRTTFAMVYDSRRKRVVLFGGFANEQALGDTWEWDGARWTLAAAEGPPARGLHALAFDSVRGRVVLFGGSTAPMPDAPLFDDTWEWDGARWTRVSVTGPAARNHVAMTYDPVRRMTVLHGGATREESGAGAETWAFDGKSWTRLAANGPRRVNARLMFDSKAGVPLMYGGFDSGPSNDLWKLEGTTWQRVAK